MSDEGTYYLVNHWKKAGRFWKLSSELKHDEMFSTPQAAKVSLTMLLKVMDCYASDFFFLVETNEDDKIISQTPYVPTGYYKEGGG